MVNLHGIIEALRAGRVWEPTFTHTIKADLPELNSWLLSAASDAFCFHMGDVEEVPQMDIITERFRPPYPVTWFEATNRDGLVGILSCEVGERLLEVAVFNKRLGIAWQLVRVVTVFVDDTGELRCKGLAMFSGTSAQNESALFYAAHAVNLMARFVMALTCPNNTLVEHLAPKLINAKRVAKGRQPLFSYCTLSTPASGNEIEDET